jgi:phosphoribosylaminoimidazole-succinocarboxamide synthase
MKRWSTKSLRTIVPASPSKAGIGIFDFTDDYSVFHFSKMPDRIPDKGEVVARMGHASLRTLERAGIRTHLMDRLSPTALKIRLLNVLDPARGEMQVGDTARLVPLQVIYRNRLGPGASVYRRAAAGRLTAGDLGLDRLPPPGTALPRPLVEFTTKLENIDRFVTTTEARAISCLPPEQFDRLTAMTLDINAVLCEHAAACGLILADGKVEFGVDEDGDLILVDVAGTPDENRFELGGVEVSKQVLRDYYHRFGLEAEVQRLAASPLPRPQWPSPPPLPPALLEATSEMYRALCECWTGERVWQAQPLDVAAQAAAAALAEATTTASPRRGRHA